MNILNNVRIGSSDYKVLVSDQVLIVDRSECKGMIDFEFHQIKINNQVQDKQGQEQTLLHELIHGIVRERNLDLLNSDEETIVEEISLGLHQVIRDNPKMFSYESKQVNCNIEFAIEEGKNIKDININELTESVARNISNALKNQIEGR